MPLAPARDGFAGADLASRVDLGAAPPDTSGLPDQIGDACSGACAAGLTCMTWVAAGYCSRTCVGPADCAKGSSCVDVGGGASYCLLDSNGGCTRADLTCINCGAKVCGPASLCEAC